MSPRYCVQEGPCRTWQKLTTFIEFNSMSSPWVGDSACARADQVLVHRFGGHPAPIFGVIRADGQLDHLPRLIRVIACRDELEGGPGIGQLDGERAAGMDRLVKQFVLAGKPSLLGLNLLHLVLDCAGDLRRLRDDGPRILAWLG